MRILICLLLINTYLLFVDLGFSQVTIHNKQFFLKNSPEYVTVTMDGFLDSENTYTASNSVDGGIGFEPMISLRISNLGNKIVHAPRVVINNKRRWFDIQSLSEEFLSGVLTNKEKALSIWKLMRDNRFHCKTPVSLSDPIMALGIYGYMTCGTASVLMTSIGSALGYPGRVWHLRYKPQPERGHAISEIDFGDGDVILDIDAHVFFLDYDNETLIGNDEVTADNFLVDRTHFFGKSRMSDLDMGVMFNTNNPSTGAGNNYGHSLDITLRPGESIIYDWADANLFHHIYSPIPNPIPWLIANSRFVYQPQFITAKFDDLFDNYENLRVSINSGQTPLIHADSLNGSSYFVIKIESPFVMLDGSVQIHGFQNSSEDILRLDFSLDHNTWSELWSSSHSGFFKDSVDFGMQNSSNGMMSFHSSQQDSLELFFPNQAYSSAPADSVSFMNKKHPETADVMGIYKYYLRFSLSPTDSITDCGIDSICIATIIQTSKRFMPGLILGENYITYTDTDSFERNVELEIEWRESNENTPPETITTPVFPLDRSEPEHTQFTFSWSVPADPDGDEIVDYEFQLSDREDMRFPLSTNFEMYLSALGDSIKPEYRIPWPGLLNDGISYFWRVRAKDIRGVWGNWSPVWSFIPHSVMMPLNGEVIVKDNEYFLHWQANNNGYVPTYYEVHGSNEPNGFFADTSTIIGICSELEFNITENIYDYYRVIAFDSQNQSSGPSRLIHIDSVLLSVPGLADKTVTPLVYNLEQNYPNPFNPTTKISFTLLKPHHVSLKVYNTLGQKVTTLLEQKMSAGSHDVQMNASTLTSGIYFYEIQAGDFRKIRKMILLK